MSAYLSRLTRTRDGWRSGGTGPQAGNGAERIGNAATVFEEMGFHYMGPDRRARLRPASAGPGEGSRLRTSAPFSSTPSPGRERATGPAEASSDRCHSVAKFDIATGVQVKAKAAAPSYTKVFGETLVKEATKDERIVAVTAAMPSGTGLDIFGKAFPDRTFDVGIAEQHAVTFAAGMAAEGYKPFCAIYSTFLQRGYDQVVHDVALQSLPVRFAVDRAGLVGADGPTHAGSFDVAYLACLPGFVVMAAADEAELAHMVATAAAIDDRPSAFRYPRGEGVGAPIPLFARPLKIGKGRVVREGSDVALLSLGARLAECLKAADELDKFGLSTTVADARFAKPLDVDLILRLADEHDALITIEEGSIGGFGSHVMHLLLEHGRLDGALQGAFDGVARPVPGAGRSGRHVRQGQARRERHRRQGVRGAQSRAAGRAVRAGPLSVLPPGVGKPGAAARPPGEAAGLLRRRRAGDRYRGAFAGEVRRSGLRAA